MSKVASVRIVDALRESILDGVLPPGRQIRQEALAEKFAVSRLPVREALRQLEAEGLIQTELHKGAFVSSLSLPEVIEMLDIRIGLELRALKLAVPNFTKEHAKESERILKRYDEARVPAWRDLNLTFHLALHKPCNRPRLVKMIEYVVLETHRFLRTYISATLGPVIFRPDPRSFRLGRMTALGRYFRGGSTACGSSYGCGCYRPEAEATAL